MTSNHSFWGLYTDNGSDWMTVTGNAVWSGGSPWGYCHDDHYPGEGGGLDNQLIQGNYWQGSPTLAGPGAGTAPDAHCRDLRQHDDQGSRGRSRQHHQRRWTGARVPGLAPVGPGSPAPGAVTAALCAPPRSPSETRHLVASPGVAPCEIRRPNG